MNSRRQREREQASANPHPKQSKRKWITPGMLWVAQIISKGWDLICFRGLGPEARFAGWVARFTLVLCIVGTVQTWAFIASERANLTISEISSAAFPPTPGNALILHISIQNAGKSTARVIGNTTNFQYSGEPLPDKPGYVPCDNCSIPLAIVGGNIIHTTFHPISGGRPLGLTADQYREIKAGTRPFYIFGYITYRDDFSFLLGSKTLGFCAVFDPANDVATGPFDACPNPNYSYSR